MANKLKIPAAGVVLVVAGGEVVVVVGVLVVVVGVVVVGVVVVGVVVVLVEVNVLLEVVVELDVGGGTPHKILNITWFKIPSSCAEVPTEKDTPVADGIAANAPMLISPIPMALTVTLGTLYSRAARVAYVDVISDVSLVANTITTAGTDPVRAPKLVDSIVLAAKDIDLQYKADELTPY